MSRFFLLVVTVLTFSIPLWSGGCGSAGGSEFGNPALTGVLPSSSGAALLKDKNQAGTCGSLTTVRSVCGETQKDALVGDDCSFTISLEPDVYCYVQFLGADDSVAALLAWQDPTQPDDESPRRLTSYVKMGREQNHALGQITLEGTTAVPEFAPIGFDTDGNGVPDDQEEGFQTGSDTDSDGVPEIFVPQPPDIETPFTPAIGLAYTSTQPYCGLGTSIAVTSAVQDMIVLDPFGNNAATTFLPRSSDPATADSFSDDLTIFELGGFACQVAIDDALVMTVTCQNGSDSACEQKFLPVK